MSESTRAYANVRVSFSRCGSMCACGRVCVSVSACLETAPASPFIVEGGTGAIHAFAMQRLVSGGGVSESCSLLLWRHGQ